MRSRPGKLHSALRALAALLAALLLPLPAAAAETDAITVDCYAVVNNAWSHVAALRTERKVGFGDSAACYCVAASELEAVYADYGFSAADLAAEDGALTGRRLFPHTVQGDLSLIWADRVPVRESADGDFLIPLSKKQLHSYLYYLPKNETPSASYFEEKKPIGDAQLLADNSFYSLEVSDPSGLVYGPGALPEKQILPAGEEMTITLPQPEGVRWEARDIASGETVSAGLTDNGDGTITFYAAAAVRGIQLIPAREGFGVRYVASLRGRLQPFGRNTHDPDAYSYPVSMQVITADATIRGAAYWTDVVSEGSGTILAAPDTDRAEVRLDKSQVADYKDRRFYYTFAGWEAEDGSVYPAGAVLSADALAALDANGDGTAELRGVWNAADALGRVASVNFYVNKSCEIADNLTNGYATGDGSANFTPVIFGTRVLGMEALEFDTFSPYLLTAKVDDDASAYAVDAEIRAMTSVPVQGITLEQLPADEDVLAYLRETRAVIQVDGEEVPSGNLTTENFKVRWATLKYEPHDGWHLDGILVSRAGRLVVTKTFSGDGTAAAEAMADWSGAVEHLDAATGERVLDFALTPDTATAYDPETNTCLWSLPARRGREYLVSEQGGVLSGEGWLQSAQYAVRNSAAATAGYADYTGPVAVTAESYPADVPDSAVQTVALRSLSVRSGEMSFHKIDAATGDGLAGVSFTLARADETPETLAVFRVPDTARYLAIDPAHTDEGILGEYTEAVPDGVLTTDAGGWLYLRLSPLGGTSSGEYRLRETVPTGYFGAAELKLTVLDEDGLRFDAVVADAGTAAEPAEGWLSVSGGIYTLRNVSRQFLTVTAEAVWADEPERVTLELWCNGAKVVGADYTQTLSDENGWSCTWTDLPLFLNGALADYALRETAIGSTAYDPGTDADGYADYTVTRAVPQYWCGADFLDTEPVYAEPDGTLRYADRLLLTIHNARTRGEVSFVKTDAEGRPLRGAEFTLYSDAACERTAATAVSDSGGVVAFAPLPVGTYYLRETAAPAGYTADGSLWRVAVRAVGSTVYAPDGSTVAAIKNTPRTNLLLRTTDPDGAPLAAAAFRVWRDDRLLGEYAVDAMGLLRLDTLADGDYTIRETAAPAGYACAAEIAVLRAAGGTVTLLRADELPLWTLSGPDADGTWTLTVRCEPLWSIPSVGGPGVYPVMALGTALMALTVLLALLPRLRKRGSAQEPTP